MTLWNYRHSTGAPKSKWDHYFEAYELHLQKFRKTNVSLLEIGVSTGESLGLWRNYLGPFSHIVGVDIDESAVAHVQRGIDIRIGDQSDIGFLASVNEEFGPFDIIVDDGSYMMPHIVASFSYLYPRLSRNWVYVVEDLHTAYWQEFGGGLNSPGSFVNISKQFVDRLNADCSRGQVEPDFITKNTFSTSFYDSMVVYQRGRNRPRYCSGWASRQ